MGRVGGQEIIKRWSRGIYKHYCRVLFADGINRYTERAAEACPRRSFCIIYSVENDGDFAATPFGHYAVSLVRFIQRELMRD